MEAEQRTEALIVVDGDAGTNTNRDEIAADLRNNGTCNSTNARTSPPTINNDNDDSTFHYYYAVRKGQHVKCCIFLQWEDCQAEIENLSLIHI